MLILAKSVCQSDLVSVVSNFKCCLNIFICCSLNFEQSKIEVDDKIAGCPEFGSDHREPLVAVLEERVYVMTHPARGQFWNVISGERFALGLIELSKVNISTQQDNS